MRQRPDDKRQRVYRCPNQEGGLQRSQDELAATQVAKADQQVGHVDCQYGKYKQPEDLFLRALAIREQVFSPTHLDVAVTLHTLGALYLRQGSYAQAEPILQRALAIREQTLGLDHPDTAKARRDYARLLQASQSRTQSMRR